MAETRKEEVDYLVLSAGNNSIQCLRDGALIADIPLATFKVVRKMTKTGLDIKDGSKPVTGGKYGEIIINDTPVNEDNADELVTALRKAAASGCSGGGGSDYVTNEHLNERLSGYVPYTNEKNIVLENDHKILGTDLEGSQHNLIELSRWDIIDVGSASTQLNFNGPDVPTYQPPGATGDQVLRLATRAASQRGDLSESTSVILAEYGNFRVLVQKINDSEIKISTQQITGDTTTAYYLYTHFGTDTVHSEPISAEFSNNILDITTIDSTIHKVVIEFDYNETSYKVNLVVYDTDFKRVILYVEKI